MTPVAQFFGCPARIVSFFVNVSLFTGQIFDSISFFCYYAYELYRNFPVLKPVFFAANCSCLENERDGEKKRENALANCLIYFILS